MSRKFFFSLLFVLAVNTLIALPACASSFDSEKKPLVVGVVLQDNFPLVYFDKETSPRGFEVFMVRHLAKTGGFEPLEIRKFPDQESLRRAVRDHEIDFAFSKMKKDPADAERFIYSEAHLTVEYVFLLNRKIIAANGIQVDPLVKIAGSDLIIGTLDTSLYAEKLRSIYPEKNIKLFSSIQDVFDAVVSGEIAACFLDEIEVKGFFLNSPSQALKLQYVQGSIVTDSVALVFPWDKLFFREWVNIFLTKEGYTRTQLSEVIDKYTPDLTGMQKN